VNKEGNGVYVFVIDGNVTINGQELQSRDGLGIWETDSLQIKAGSEAQLLLIDVPMSIPGV
jgi:redox-sensitive bicupin YhaK (pirin superfamily)